VGDRSGSSGAVTVSGAGSTWASSDDIYIGREGDGTLHIDDGGTVSNENAYVGYRPGSTGGVTVTGSGSNWISTDWIRIGNEGYGTLDITNGGTASTPGCSVGNGLSATGAVTINGAGSTWTHSGGLGIGGSGNGTLDIINGGAVDAAHGHIGTNSGSTGVVTVSGAESTWANSSSLTVGMRGDGTLNVTDGGSVIMGGGNIGRYSGSSGVVTVSGAGSTWTGSEWLTVGSSGDGVLNIADGGLVEVSEDTETAGAAGSTGEINFDNGTLTTGGFRGDATSLNGSGTLNTSGLASDVNLVFDGTHGLAQTWTLNGPGRNITVNLDVDGSGLMGVGYSSSASLRIADGLDVRSTDGYLGYKAGSTGTATVSGAGSIWANSGDLDVGRYGDGTLNIAGGGLVEVDGETHVARYAGSAGAIGFDNGTLTTGGLLAAADDLNGTGTVNTKGLVSDVDLVFDETRGLSQTLALTGSGRNITVNLDVNGSGSMGAGHGGSGSVHISDGLIVQSINGYLGYQSGSTGVATVSGTDSKWANSRWSYVGYHGDGVLDITDGGAVSTMSGYIGDQPGSTGVATVSGIGSEWIYSYLLYVGHHGDGRLEITDGGTVTSTGVLSVIGYKPGSTGVVTISGEGSTWTSSGRVQVGGGSGMLHITDGGVLSISGCSISGGSGHPSAVTVSGVGSTWVNSSWLTVGNSGVATLDIINGGTVNGTYTTIARSGSTGTVTVSGAGSSWTNSSWLTVGSSGDATLDIADGGVVNCTKATIGKEPGPTGAVTVSGAGSKWAILGDFQVARRGDATMDIARGGFVSNTLIGQIAYEPGSTGAVTVSGAGSTWANASDLYVGYYGVGTLNIANGGLVNVDGELTIDNNRDGDSFVTMATGGMLALYGKADDSLGDLLGLISGTDDIRYWDNSVSDWAPITGATLGEDYTLDYMTEGDLAGYTVLTVPEPATMTLLALGGLAILRRRGR